MERSRTYKEDRQGTCMNYCKGILLPVLSGRIIGFILLLLAGFSVQAEQQRTGDYWGFQAGNSLDRIASNVSSNNVNRGYLKLRYGTYLDDYLAAEGHIGAISNSRTDEGIVTLSGFVRAERVYGKAKYYGILGYSGIFSYHDVAGNESEFSLSYGVGVELFGGPDTSIALEYVSVIDTDLSNGNQFSFDTIGIGFTHYFVEESSKLSKTLRNRRGLGN